MTIPKRRGFVGIVDAFRFVIEGDINGCANGVDADGARKQR
jgi:hypothetical protein